jgi:FkbM family methyltransferase
MTRSRSLAALLLRIRPALLGQWIKRLLRWGRVEVQVADGRFWLDMASNFGIRVTSAEGYEPETKALLVSFLKPGMAFVDLGANEGFFSVIAARAVGPTGRVLAIEPQSRLGPVIRRNLELNDAANVTLAQVAISAEAGVAEFNLAPDTNSGSSGLSRATRYANPTQSVRTLTLDLCLQEHALTMVDVMKIDIEGYEYEAVLGAKELFRTLKVRRLLIEIHDKLLSARGLRPQDISDFLLSCGYERQERLGFEVYTSPHP